jgi:hypothetical protein
MSNKLGISNKLNLLRILRLFFSLNLAYRFILDSHEVDKKKIRVVREFLSVNSLNYGYFPNLVRNRAKFSNNFDTFISSLALIRNL